MLQRGEIDAVFHESLAAAVIDRASFITSKNYFPFYYAPISIATAQTEPAPSITAIDKALSAGLESTLTGFYDEGNRAYDRTNSSRSSALKRPSLYAIM